MSESDRFSLRAAMEASRRGEIKQWLQQFLVEGDAGNESLWTYIENRPGSKFIGPIEIPTAWCCPVFDADAEKVRRIEAICLQAELPPILLRYRRGLLEVTDGHNRLQAYKNLGRSTCLVLIEICTEETGDDQVEASSIEGISERILDAEALWALDRREGAFLSALIAVAAAARLVGRKGSTDRELFEEFLSKRKYFQMIQSVEFRGQQHTVQHIFYKWLRCKLVHEGNIPFDIEFIDEGQADSVFIRVGGAPNHTLKFTYNWFFELINAAREGIAIQDR